MTHTPIRFGVIGFGNIGSMHVCNLSEGKIENAVLSAVCDISEAKRKKAAAQYPDAAIFADYRELLSSGKADAVIVAVPHELHCPIAVAALEAGLHVLTEKPAGIRVSDVKRMNEAAEKSDRAYGIMFNQRTNALFAKARELVRSGALGEKKRLTWIITNWYRTQHYYDSGDWRASWRGEGGGVLTNQAPHNLDIAQWIFGMPQRLRAFCMEGQYHTITVEDFAMLHGEYENGATLQFITTTGEYPGTNRLEIVLENGKIVIEEGKLKLWRLKESEKALRFFAKESMPSIPYEYSELLPEGPESAHCGILQNFTDHILKKEELLAKGEDGLNQVMLTNAAYLSSWTNDWVTLPFDEESYNARLEEKRREERPMPKDAAASEENETMLPRWRVNW